jgi:serine/threonine protein kinase
LFSLTCFVCPAADFEERAESDRCATCGREYGFPLTELPAAIEQYRVIKALGRGFYAATYLAEYGRLNQRVVLKVASKKVYEFFAKDFEAECKLHQEVALGTKHVVGITDYLESEVDFGGTRLLCHVAVLNYVEGTSLAKFISDEDAHTVAAVAQVAVDLLQLLNELRDRRVFHNDLHDANILVERLPATSLRPEALDGSVRAVAIDLGSAAPDDREDDKHLGDIPAVVKHLFDLKSIVLQSATQEAAEYRLASVLDEIGHQLAPDRVSQREPDYLGAIRRIRIAFQQGGSGWSVPPGLQNFDDSYNAQTLHPWYLPRLLVDPDGQWVSSVSVRGPQVITGMRGCGKTMLLRALDVHARIMTHEQIDQGSVPVGISQDGYVGLYVSCNRLLDALGGRAKSMHEPYARLYLAYAREACRALQHLREVSPMDVPHDAYLEIASATSAVVGESESIAESDSLDELERTFQVLLGSLDRGESDHRLLANPAIAFPQLADAISRSTPIWHASQVLFLLDDVSTRLLGKGDIGELLSALMFNSPGCSFKLTTEAQTLELVLKSPGQIESAQAGRDYEVFDLGAAVNAKLRDTKSSVKGSAFIASVLAQRAGLYGLHPSATPQELLGDASLESIARIIVSTTANSKEKKSAYHGLSALRAVCVGDIGDVISIYDRMLRKAGQARQVPIDARDQTEALQEYCARRLYNVSRRDGRLKDFALTFAAASHQLLMKSHAELSKTGRGRLRQYSSVYVRLSADKDSAQYDQIRELVDSGVFVLEGGADTPRTKSRDRDPIQQFVLTYRKLFGLSSFIGLAERDRFELSGTDLAEWLSHPEDGVKILLRNLGGDSDAEIDSDAIETLPKRDSAARRRASQTRLWIAPEESVAKFPHVSPSSPYLISASPQISEIAEPEIEGKSVEQLVLGLGFEERTLSSTAKLLSELSFSKITLVKYPIDGFSKEISTLAKQTGAKIELIDYADIAGGNIWEASGESVAVDATGLAKGALFRAVTTSLSSNRELLVFSTKAASYYPLDAEIEKVLKASTSQDPYALVEKLAAIWPGEAGPYDFRQLVSRSEDESRLRVLCAASAAKAERLLSLIDARDFDYVSLSAPSAEGPRAQLARLAAQVVAPDGLVSSVAEGNLAAELDFIAAQFQHWFVELRFDFEIALTGSKTHAVAAAIATASLPVSRVWYVAPATFDPVRFTHGVGGRRAFQIHLGEDS